MVHQQSRSGALDDSGNNRNSLHLRGTSHNSALKEKQRQHMRNINGTDPNSSADLDRGHGTFFSRLSSLPEQRGAVATLDAVTEGAKSLLFSLHSLQPYMNSLVPLANADGSKRSSLERVFYNSSNQLDALDKALQSFMDNPPTDDSQRRQQDQNLRRACRACLVAYSQVGRLLIKNARHLVHNADPRYIRMLLILIYGSTIEAGHAFESMKRSKEEAFGRFCPTQSDIHSTQDAVAKPAVPSFALGQVERPSTSRKIRQDPNAGERLQVAASSTQHEKSASQPSHSQSAAPTQTNSQSRSGSGATNHMVSTPSANTPRSGESFLYPYTPAISTHGGEPGSARSDGAHDGLFQKIFVSFQTFVEETQQIFQQVTFDLDRRSERARKNSENKSRIELWARLAAHARATLTLCQSQSRELANMDMGNTARRNSPEFWMRIVKPGLSFADFCSQIKQATTSYRGEPLLVEVSKAVKPCLRLLKAASTNLELSPWKNAPTQSPTGFAQTLTVQTQWPNAALLGLSPRQRLNGHHRTQNGSESGSGSSAFIPTTPLSAALGPAAAATGPLSSGTGGFDRSFQGDVFQRAAYALNNSGHNGTYRRNG